jgi:hypothetical protein
MGGERSAQLIGEMTTHLHGCGEMREIERGKSADKVKSEKKDLRVRTKRKRC